MRQDIGILKRAGANAVRVHYPITELFLDYCDQNGLVVMSEVASWQYRPEHLANPEIQNKTKRHFEEMLHRDMNHPSILTWSLGNPATPTSGAHTSSSTSWASTGGSRHPPALPRQARHPDRIRRRRIPSRLAQLGQPNHALTAGWLSGGCVWQYSDPRSAPERVLAGRLHGWNGKGIVDAHRAPKLAYYRLQQVFRANGAKGQ